MAKKKLTGTQVRKLILADEERKFRQERAAFMNWWRTVPHRMSMSPLKAGWEAWKQRAGVKAPEDE